MKSSFKKIFSILCLLLLCSNLTITSFAKNSTIKQTSELFNILNSNNNVIPQQESFYDLGRFDNIGNKKISGTENINMKSRSVWQINDSVFIGNGNLTDGLDIYVTTLNSKSLSFLKLESSNSNLMAILYYINSDGTLGNSTGWGVYANKGDSFINIPEGNYAIIIGSASGTETGNYKLMWNCSNPAGAKKIIDRTADLGRVVILYDTQTIRSNGTNILNKLKWEEHETWYMPSGYSGRDMAITMTKAKAIYTAAFSSSKPYSTNRALLVEVEQGSWLYMNSYYKNVNGDVEHIMDYRDPSGLLTPRTFGTGASDFTYGSNYIVIDLNTFQVVEFLSPFNFHYTKEGGRTFTLSDPEHIS